MLSSLPPLRLFGIGLYLSVLKVLWNFFYKRNLLSHSSRSIGRLEIWNQVISRAVLLWRLQGTICSLLHPALLAPRAPWLYLLLYMATSSLCYPSCFSSFHFFQEGCPDQAQRIIYCHNFLILCSWMIHFYLIFSLHIGGRIRIKEF